VRTVQRDKSHRLLLLCCPIVCFSTACACSGQLNYPQTTRQMQLAAVPKLLPPPEMARGIPHEAAREVQGRLLPGLGQRGDRILLSLSGGVHTAACEI
jgi:hypothetical protein